MRYLRYSMKNSIPLLFLFLVCCVVNSCKFCPDQPDIVIQYLDKPLAYKVPSKAPTNGMSSVQVICKGYVSEDLEIDLDNQIKGIGHNKFTIKLEKGKINKEEVGDFYSKIPALITLKPSKKLKGNLKIWIYF